MFSKFWNRFTGKEEPKHVEMKTKLDGEGVRKTVSAVKDITERIRTKRIVRENKPSSQMSERLAAASGETKRPSDAFISIGDSPEVRQSQFIEATHEKIAVIGRDLDLMAKSMKDESHSFGEIGSIVSSVMELNGSCEKFSKNSRDTVNPASIEFVSEYVTKEISILCELCSAYESLDDKNKEQLRLFVGNIAKYVSFMAAEMKFILESSGSKYDLLSALVRFGNAGMLPNGKINIGGAAKEKASFAVSGPYISQVATLAILHDIGFFFDEAIISLFSEKGNAGIRASYSKRNDEKDAQRLDMAKNQISYLVKSIGGTAVMDKSDASFDILLKYRK